MSCFSFSAIALQAEEPPEEEPTEEERVVVRGYRVVGGGVWFWEGAPEVGFFDLGRLVDGGGSGPGREVDPNETDDDSCDSGTPSGETTSQPVDIATGTKLLYELDISAGSRDQPLLVLRSYRSTRTGSGLFGGKWS